MKVIMQLKKIFNVNNLLLLMFFTLLKIQPAFADLISGMEDLQSKISTISTPLAIILLIFAGIMKAMGNSQIFALALIGTIIMFAAPQIVTFIQTSFGG